LTGASSSTECTNPNCENGWIFVDDNTVRPCSCQLQRRTERLFRASRITRAFREKTFDTFNPSLLPVIRRLHDAARDYADRFTELCDCEQNWLVLLGTPGAGKTHLSMAVCNELIERGVGVLYLPYLDFIKELRDAVGTDRDMGQSIEHAKTIDLLYIDDLFKGRSRPTEFVLETIIELIYYRYLETLPTIINSEWLPERLQQLDAGLARRIVERGAGHLVTVNEPRANYSLHGERFGHLPGGGR